MKVWKLDLAKPLTEEEIGMTKKFIDWGILKSDDPNSSNPKVTFGYIKDKHDLLQKFLRGQVAIGCWLTRYKKRTTEDKYLKWNNLLLIHACRQLDGFGQFFNEVEDKTELVDPIMMERWEKHYRKKIYNHH